MLSTIREKTQGLFATIVIVIIGVPFALWGINSYFENNASNAVAEVNGVEIGDQRYREAFDQRARAMQQMMGGRVDARLFSDPGFKRQVLESLVDEVLVVQAAQDAGYRIGDSQLSAEIATIPQFQSEGRFDPARYQEALRNAGYTSARFEQGMRQDLLAQQFGAGFGETAAIGVEDVNALIRVEAQQREYRFVLFPAARYVANAQVPDSTVTEYFESHPDEFKTTERVKLQYVRLGIDQLKADANVSEDELRAAYEDEVGRFSTPEERRASHILIELPPNADAATQAAAQKRAEELYARARKGEDFAKLARAYSKDPGSATKGGDLGFSRRGAFVKEFEDALFAMQTGDISKPVKTQYGYHIIKLTAVKPGTRKPLAAVKGEIEQQVRQRKAEERFYELSERLNDLLYEQPDSLQPAAQALGLKVEQSDWLARGTNAGILADPRVAEAAFSPEVLQQKRNSDAIEAGPNAVIALRVAEHQPAVVRPLSEVREQIVAKLKREQARDQATKAGEAALAQLKDGGHLSAVAQGAGLQPSGLQTSTRQPAKTNAGTDPRLLAAVFAAPRPADNKASIGGVALGNDGYAVYEVVNVRDGDPAKAEAGVRQRAEQNLKRRFGAEFYRAYIADLRRAANVKTYPDRLN